MKRQANLIIVIAVLVFSVAGCSMFRGSQSVSDDRFPAEVGSLKKEMVWSESREKYFNEKNKGSEYVSIKAKFSDKADEFFYSINTHESESGAINEQARIADGGGARTCLKPYQLNDKNGKNVGTLTVCRKTEPSAEATRATTGGRNYAVAFSLGSVNHVVDGSTVISSKNQTDKLIAFVKELPAASGLDLNILDVFTTAMAGKGITPDKIAAVTAPRKLSPKAYLNGKTVVYLTGDISQGIVTDEYLTNASKRAVTMDEVGSIVKIECRKGERIGVYTLKETGAKIPAFGRICELSIIDQSIPALVFTKTFTNNAMVEVAIVETDKDGNLKKDQKEDIAPLPRFEISEFIASLPSSAK